MANNLHTELFDERMTLVDERALVIFTNISCRECKEGATEIAKLAYQLQDSPKVFRADCTFDKEACDLLVNHIPSSNNTYPYIIMMTDTHSFKWTGPIDAEKIINNFATGKKYMEYPKHGGERGDYRLRNLVMDGGFYIG